MKKLLTICTAAMVAAGCFSCGKKTDAPTSESVPVQTLVSLRSANITMAEDFEEIISFDRWGKLILIFGRTENGDYSGYITDSEFIDHTDFTFTPSEGETVKGAALMRFGKSAVLTVLDGSTMIYVFNKEGKQEKTFDCGEIIDGDIYSKLFTSEDGFYIDVNRDSIAFVDPEGNYVGDVKLGGKYISGIATNSDGITTVLLNDPDGTSLAELSGTELSNEKPCSHFDVSALTFCAGNEDYSFVMTSGDAMYGLKDDQWVKICDFMDNDFNAYNIFDLIVTDKNEFAAAIWGDGGTRLTLLSERDISDLKARKVIKMAVSVGSDSSNIPGKNEAKSFNSENDEYRVEIINYGERGEYPEDWAKAMKEDIISGNAPDIVFFDSNIPIDTFGSKGSIFVDFYQLIDSDPDISRDDFVDGFLEGFESDGKLFMIDSIFSLNSMCIKDKFTGGLTEWNLDQFIDVYNNMPEGMMLSARVENAPRRDVFKNLFNFNDFVDYDNAVCTFDSPEFIKAMKFFNDNKLGLTQEEYDSYGAHSWGYQEEGVLYRNDEAMVEMCFFMGFSYIREQLQGRFNEPATLIGYPSENGNGTYRRISSGYGIMANSENIEGAWEFLKYYLFESDYQSWYFSGLKEKYNAQLEYEKTPITDIDPETGEEVNIDFYWLGGEFGNTIVMEPFTDEEAEKYDAFVKAALKNSFKRDYEIEIILNEELDAYFEGENSAEKAADIIQTRVTLYLSEHYN